MEAGARPAQGHTVVIVIPAGGELGAQRRVEEVWL